VEWLNSAWRDLRARPPFFWDVGLAAVATVFAQATGQFSGDDNWARIPALFLSVPLAWRRQRPLLVFFIVLAAVFPAGYLDPAGSVAGAAIASYSVALYSRYRWVSLGAILIEAVLILAVFGGGLPPLPDFTAPFVILVPAWLIGNALRIRQLRADLFETRARQLEQQQEQARQAAVLQERGRIARELHDVVAHSVSMMVVQAGAAREVLKQAPDAPVEATQSLLSVEASGREALTELRHMLGALSTNGSSRSEEQPAEADAGIAPQPGLQQLEPLVQRVRDTGLPVSVEIDGEERPLPSGVDIAAYRIVQEALTNAMRYAGSAPTEVTLHYREDELKIEVLDDGPGVGRIDGAPGHGLTGMRERVAIFGGKLEAGPRLERGYAVRAWLPLHDPPA
jgi:signal transduction histidine kinase